MQASGREIRSKKGMHRSKEGSTSTTSIFSSCPTNVLNACHKYALSDSRACFNVGRNGLSHAGAIPGGSSVTPWLRNHSTINSTIVSSSLLNLRAGLQQGLTTSGFESTSILAEALWTADNAMQDERSTRNQIKGPRNPTDLKFWYTCLTLI